MKTGSTDTRTNKKKPHIWKRAVVQFLVCFVLGFFTGFAPTGKSSFFSSQVLPQFASQSIEIPLEANSHVLDSNKRRISVSQVPTLEPKFSDKQETGKSFEEPEELVSRKLIIIISPTNMKCKSEVVFLRKLSNTLALVPQPLLWIVVEPLSDSPEVSDILRKTGIMYRHVVYKENFTDPKAEIEHQRNAALSHIEHHKLSGIVHVAELSNVYDLGFFDEIRDIEGFGSWPVASVSGNSKEVVIEGPMCDDFSQVIGWHKTRKNNRTGKAAALLMPISSFALNSSILWDPERWGRSSLIQDASQNSIDFVKQAVYEDETKLKGLPSQDCSRIMLWHLQHFPSTNHPSEIDKETATTSN